MVNSSRKNWIDHLDLALWAYYTTYNTYWNVSLRSSLLKDLLITNRVGTQGFVDVQKVELQSCHRGSKITTITWALRVALSSLWVLHKEKTKAWHDSCIHRHKLHIWQKVLLFNSHLHLFLGKLHLRWSRSFFVKEIFSDGAIEITYLDDKNVFKVSGQRLKAYLKDINHIKFYVDLM